MLSAQLSTSTCLRNMLLLGRQRTGRRATTLWTDALAFGKYYLFENYLRNKGCRIGRLWRPALLRIFACRVAHSHGCPCSAGRDPKPCATAWNKQCGAARNEQGHGRLPKSVRCGNALGFRVGLAVDWVCLLRSLPRRPDRCATAWGGEKEGINPIIETKVQEGHSARPSWEYTRG